jgi:ribosomal-protein-alanine N-acetyltransferase
MALIPIIQLSNCTVRAYNKADAEALAQAANNPKIARWMQDTFPNPYTIEDAKSWVHIASAMSKPLDYAICEPGGTAIGGVGLKARDNIHYRTMEIGYWLSEDYWHRGIASQVAAAFSNWAFENFDHVVRLEAEVYEGNLASCRVLEKAGFEFEGRQRAAVEKLGKILDTFTYVKIRPGI